MGTISTLGTTQPVGVNASRPGGFMPGRGSPGQGYPVNEQESGGNYVPSVLQSFLPSPTWQNQFSAPGKSPKAAVHFDGRIDQTIRIGITNGTSTLQLSTTVPTPALSITCTPTALRVPINFAALQVVTTTHSPALRVLPGPAWANQFDRKTGLLRPVLFDLRIDTSLSLSPLSLSSHVPSPTLTIKATPSALLLPVTFTRNPVYIQQTPGDPASAFVSPAWLNRFAPKLGRKYPVFSDGRLDQNIQATAVICNIQIPSDHAVISGVSFGPLSASPGPAWRNVFGPRLRRFIVLYDNRQLAFQPVLCLTNSIGTDSNLYGGTATLASLDATDGGTATDTHAGLAGTETDPNAGYGGTEAETNLYGGSQAEAHLYGGTQSSGC